jgi:SNF2 family DNA or RNA helicase
MEELLKNYSGRNPFILLLKSELTKRNLTDFEKEYLSINLRYCGDRFEDLKLGVGRRNVEYLNKQFGTQKDFSEITIDFLYGETSEVYHFGYKRASFFVYKDECEDPFKKRISLVPFDPTKYEGENNTLNRTLFPHQVEGVRFMKLANPAFNWDDVGLGKTASAIVAALDCGYSNVLVVTLASLKLNWKREVEMFKQTAKVVSGTEFNNSPSTFTIINYEILKNFVSVKKGKKQSDNNILIENRYDCIILDEVHRAKNPDSIQSACIKELCSQSSLKKVIGLSATPFERNVDFYNICRTINTNVSDLVLANGWFQDMIDKYKEYALNYCNAYEQVIDTPKSKFNKESIMGVIPDNLKSFGRIKGVLNIIEQHGYKKGKNWEIAVQSTVKPVNTLTQKDCEILLRSGLPDKRKKVMVLGRKVGDKKIENSNSEELFQRIKHTQIVRKKTEVLDFFPNKFVFPLYFELSHDEKLEYRSMWEEYLSERPIKKASQEELAIVSQSIKMREFLAKLKIQHTTNFVEGKIEDGLKVIIFTHFKEEYEAFMKHFPKIAVGINASMSPEKKQGLIDSFQNDDKVKVIIGNIKTLGTGHNLTKGDVAVINSPDWNSGEHEQAEGRSWRIGRKEDVTVYYCLFDATHEEEVFERARQKQENKNIIMK